MTCDSTSDSADEADSNDDITEDDKKFMTVAQEYSKRSEDEQTKVKLWCMVTSKEPKRHRND